MIKQFINDIRKYWKYIKYSTKSQLKAEVTDSYLSWIWLFLEPICFMLIYTFIAGTVFKSKTENFAIFVFIGLTIWSFFQKTVITSIKLVVSNRDIVTKVYLPKHVLLITKMGVNSVKFFISFLLVIICMLIYRVPISFNVLYFIPIFIILFIVTFGVSIICMHFGVFVQDLANIATIGLRLVFYVSGVFFSIDTRIPSPYNEILLILNPIASLIHQCRRVLMYCMPMDISVMLIWLLIGVVLSLIGLRMMYKYENTYVKVMR